MKDIRSQDIYSILSQNLLLADVEDLDNLTEADILIRSGQYFSTLATRLDKISLELKDDNESYYNYIQLLVDELLYIQSRYKIKKK